MRRSFLKLFAGLLLACIAGPRDPHAMPASAETSARASQNPAYDFPACHAPFADLLSSRTFAAYPAALPPHRMPPAAPDVSRGQAHLYRTVIRLGARKVPNFAGHYTLIRIGCGAATTCVAIADALTGKVVFPPQLRSVSAMLVDTGDAEVDTLNVRRDSNLIVAIGTVNERPNGFGLYHFVWSGGRLHQRKFVPAARLC